jgi:hypothetical protein
MNDLPRNGDYLVTSLSDLEKMMIRGDTDCNPPVLKSYGAYFSALQMFYGLLLDSLGRASILLRPIDFILKILGFKWGGYNAIIVSRFRKKI